MAYDWSRYHGYQVQQNALSVAEVVQDAVETVFKSGRTSWDAHRRGRPRQPVFFPHGDLQIPPEAAVIALNNCLPGDIAMLSCTEIPAGQSGGFSRQVQRLLERIRLQNLEQQGEKPLFAGPGLSSQIPGGRGTFWTAVPENLSGLTTFAAFAAPGPNPPKTTPAPSTGPASIEKGPH